MKCASCGSSVALTAKFCPQCGTKIDMVETPAAEVDLAWIDQSLRAADFESEIAQGAVIANRPGGSKLLLGRLADLSLITIQIRWNMNGVNFTNRRAFADAVNKSNQTNWLCSFFYTDDLKTLSCSTCLFISGTLSAQHLVEYVDLFLNATHLAMTNGDLYRFG